MCKMLHSINNKNFVIYVVKFGVLKRDCASATSTAPSP
jgi:hypothetical protein